MIRSNPLWPLFFLVVLGLSLESASRGILPERLPGGFVRDGDVSFYHEGNLYEYIDGQAVVYLKFGFTLLEHGIYGVDGKAYSVDVYSLGSPLSAFGVFRQQQASAGRKTDLGGEGEVSSLLTVFYKGSSYIEINPIRSGSEDEKIIESLAHQIETVIPGAPVIPVEVSVFSEDSLVTGSQRYVDENLISTSYLGRGLTALYSVKGAEGQVRLFFGLPANDPEARRKFERFRSELKHAEPFRIGEAAGTAGEAPYQGLSAICLWRKYIFGATGLKNRESAKPLLESLLEKLQKYDSIQTTEWRTDEHEK